MKLDILVFGAHPDDIELSCAGTIIKHSKEGYKIGLIDLTRGELGTRGNYKIRDVECENATKLLGVEFRKNMNFKDGFFENNESNKIELIKVIRKYKPDIVITNAPNDRHPDHVKSSNLTTESTFLSGLEKIDTNQKPWRPTHLYYYIQFQNIIPDFVVDISSEMDQKIKSISCYKSQFYDPASIESETIISTKEFLDSISYRSQDLGRQSNCKFAEGFISNQFLKIKYLKDLV